MVMNSDSNHVMMSVQQAEYVVGLCRLESSGRGKSSWDGGYLDMNKYFTQVLEGAFKVEIEESLDSYFRTAKVHIIDRQTIFSILPLTGNELITIRYKNFLIKDSLDIPPKILHFSIVRIQEALNISEGFDKGSRVVVLHLVESPFFQFLSHNGVYKTHEIDGGDTKVRSLSDDVKKPKRLSTISSLMEECLSIDCRMKDWYDIEVEPSKCGEDFKIDLSFPNWSISKCLNYLKKFAINKKDYPYYIFYTLPPEKEGKKPLIKIESLYNLFEKTGYHNFSQTFAPLQYQSSVPGEGDVNDWESEPDKFDPLNVFFSYQINYFNIIQTAFSGLSGETFSTFDYIEDNKYIGYDYFTFTNKHKGLGDVSVHAFDYGNQWSKHRKHSFNEPQRLISMKRNEFARNQLQSAISCQVQCILNHSRKIGDMADVVFRSGMAGDTPQSMQDQLFSGRWLIWGQKDIMTLDKAYSVCHLVKEGFSQESNNTIDFDSILNKFSDNLHKRV
jgi:hypothetical protein